MTDRLSELALQVRPSIVSVVSPTSRGSGYCALPNGLIVTSLDVVGYEREVQITLGTRTLRATKLPNGDVRLRFGGHKMTQAQREQIVELEKLFQENKATGIDLSSVEELLFRMLTMLGEAPIGIKLDDMYFHKPSETQAEPAPENMSTESAPEVEENVVPPMP